MVTASVKAAAKHSKDSGSVEVQIAQLTERIEELTQHLKTHPKDNHSRRGLLKMVGKRKRLLSYLSDDNFESYSKLVGQLKIRG